MTAVDRLARYFAASALLRAVDPTEFQRRYLRGLAVQAGLHKAKRRGVVLALRRNARG